MEILIAREKIVKAEGWAALDRVKQQLTVAILNVTELVPLALCGALLEELEELWANAQMAMTR